MLDSVAEAGKSGTDQQESGSGEAPEGEAGMNLQYRCTGEVAGLVGSDSLGYGLTGRMGKDCAAVDMDQMGLDQEATGTPQRRQRNMVEKTWQTVDVVDIGPEENEWEHRQDGFAIAEFVPVGNIGQRSQVGMDWIVEGHHAAVQMRAVGRREQVWRISCHS